MFICIALGTGAGAGPRSGESVTAVSKGSAPLQAGETHLLHFAAFTLKMERETSQNALL